MFDRFVEVLCWLCFVILILFSVPSYGADDRGDIWITVGGISHHQKPGEDDNEKNFGFGFQAQMTENVRLIAQSFRNTQRVDSTLIGFAYQPWTWDFRQLFEVKAGLTVASLTGYDLDAMPVVFPVVSFEGKRFGVDYVLTREKEDKGLVHGLNFKVRF
jgi:hypothetical protein